MPLIFRECDSLYNFIYLSGLIRRYLAPIASDSLALDFPKYHAALTRIEPFLTMIEMYACFQEGICNPSYMSMFVLKLWTILIISSLPNTSIAAKSQSEALHIIPKFRFFFLAATSNS